MCDCKFCIMSKRIRGVWNTVPEDVRVIIDDLYHAWECEALDAQVNQCIINGTWDNSDEIIRLAREGLK